MGLISRVKGALSSNDADDATTGTTPTGSGTTGTTGTTGTHTQPGLKFQDQSPRTHGTQGTQSSGLTGSQGTGRQEGIVDKARDAVSGGHHSGSQGQGYTSGTSGNQGYSGSGTGTQGQSLTDKARNAVSGGSSGNQGYSGSGTGTQGQSLTDKARNAVSGGNSQGGNYSSSSTRIGNPDDLSERREAVSGIVSSTPGIQAGDAAYVEDLSAQYDTKDWQEAQRKTALAEKEVATAHLAADKAKGALAKAEHAQGVVDGSARKHEELLDEAERLRGRIALPDGLRDGVSSAEADLAARRDAAQRHNRELSEADRLARAKQGEVDNLLPQLKQHDRHLQGLSDQYDTIQQKYQAALADADRLGSRAGETDQARQSLRARIEELIEEHRLAGEDLKAREFAFLEARKRHSGLGDQLRHLQGQHQDLAGKAERDLAEADRAKRAAAEWDAKTASISSEIEEHQGKHSRLLELIRKLKAELEAALSSLEGLRRQGEPNARAIQEADDIVSNKRRNLLEAEAQAKESESRYRSLLSAADQHQAKSQRAAQEVDAAAQDYSKKLREAKLHGDKHEQLWNEAQQAGNSGSAKATDVFHKLEEKVKTFSHQ